MSVRKNGNKYLADFMHKGNRHRRQFPSEIEAQAWEAEMKRRIYLGISISDLIDGDAGIMTLGKVLDKCFERHWENSKNERQCLVNMKILENYFGADLPVENIDITAIDGFIGFMRRKGKAPATTNQKLATLSKALTFAQERGYITRKPKIERERVGNNARNRFFTQEEELKMYEACDIHCEGIFKRWLQWSIDTGLRPEETRNVYTEDVREDPRLGWVVDVNFVKSTRGSTKRRTVVLTSRAVKAFKDQSENSFDCPFSMVDNKYRQKCWDLIRKHLNDYSSDFVPYTCRHTCATRLVQSGINIKAVKEWMGHKTIDMTMKYVKLVPSDLLSGRDVLQRYEQSTNLKHA